MRAWLGRRIWDVRFSTAEARSRSRLQDAGNLDEGRAAFDVGMVLRSLLRVNTGAMQASCPSNRLVHSSRVRVLNAASKRRRSSGQR